jgi:hypothetical protein
MEALICQEKPNSEIDLNSPYDDVVSYFLLEGMEFCTIAFFYQVLMLYPVNASTTDVVFAYINNRKTKWTWNYMCACQVKHQSTNYCAVFLDWGEKPFTHSAASKFQINLDGQVYTPIMIKVLRKNLPHIHRFFNHFPLRYYMLNNDDQAYYMHTSGDVSLINNQ